MDSRVCLTHKEIYNRCTKFRIGDDVKVKEMERINGNEQIIAYKHGRILERYPFHIVIGIGAFRKESFTYTDIVTEDIVIKKIGRRKSYDN